jgi:hypothetical protein
MIRDMKRWLLLVAVVGLAVLVSNGFHDLRMQDDPVLIYQYYEEDLQRYADRLEGGKVKSEPIWDHGIRGYYMPQFLISHGARYAFKEGDCFVISFSFMPTDAVPELWYSPNGFEPLPQGLQDRQRRYNYFKWQQLSPKWGACYWDM